MVGLAAVLSACDPIARTETSDLRQRVERLESELAEVKTSQRYRPTPAIGIKSIDWNFKNDYVEVGVGNEVWLVPLCVKKKLEYLQELRMASREFSEWSDGTSERETEARLKAKYCEL